MQLGEVFKNINKNYKKIQFKTLDLIVKIVS